ncbi:hypothetical protein [Streptomyces sp. NPDC048277]|uniref:hypothetical protein n=1 Tax=Streptomyces sp. NPDC048277 TaxID=3155027 RepID=UPI0034103EA2
MSTHNPLRDGGLLERAMPWLSAAVVLLLAAGTVAGGAAPLVKAIALVAAAVIVGRSAYLIVRRGRTARRDRSGR